MFGRKWSVEGGSNMEVASKSKALSLSDTLEKALRFNGQIALGTNHVADFIWVIISDYHPYFRAFEVD